MVKNMPNNNTICTENTCDRDSLITLFKNNHIKNEKIDKLVNQVLHPSPNIVLTPTNIKTNVNAYLLELHSHRNNNKQVKNLLQAGANPHGTWGYKFHINGDHPIHNAILNANTDMLKTIIDHTKEKPLEIDCVNAILEILKGSLSGENNEWGNTKNKRESYKIANSLIEVSNIEPPKPKRPITKNTKEIALIGKSAFRFLLGLEEEIFPKTLNDNHKNELIEIIKSGNQLGLSKFLENQILLKNNDYGVNAEEVRNLIKENWNLNSPNRNMNITEALKVIEERPTIIYKSLTYLKDSYPITTPFRNNINQKIVTIENNKEILRQ